MHIETFQYTKEKGWSIDSFPKLDSEQTLITVFAAPEFFDHFAPIKELKSNYPQSKMIGCSTSGEILGSRIFDQSLVVAIIQFNKTTLAMTSAFAMEIGQSFSVGEKIAKSLDKDDLRGIFILSGSMSINGSELVRGLNTITDKKVSISGGLAGDGDRFIRPWVISDGLVASDSIVAVGFYGNHIHFGNACEGGWDVFGPERRITHSKENVLYELDGQPALELFKKYLGDRADNLPSSGLLYPLAIRKTSNDMQFVRNIIAIDERQQSLTFAGDVPEGYFAQLMRGNYERLIDSASEAGQQSVNKILKTSASSLVKKPPNNIVSFTISCIGRRLLLGERTENEVEGVYKALPKEGYQVGFYSYGQLCPAGANSCEFHNQTVTITTLHEMSEDELHSY